MNAWLSARRILAVRMDNIGDVVMVGPALRAVKERAPEARITLLASPAGALAASLLPWIDDVIVWRAQWQDVGNRVPFNPERELELVRILAEREFDAALVFSSFSQTPFVPGYVCYLAGIPLRAGESKEFGGNTLSDVITGTPESEHQVERNLRLVEALGFPVHDRRLEVVIDRQSKDVTPALLRRAGLDPSRPYVLLHPGASAEARRYPPERFGRVSELLTERGLQVLVTGVERELDLLAVVSASAPRAGVLSGGTTLSEYAALIECAAAVVCGNTLPLHLADALDTPVVAPYSGTDYESQWRPRTTRSTLLRRETPCHPCYRFSCPIGLPCLDFAPEEVVLAVEQLLEVEARTGAVLGGAR
jgi:ADP-heptose:LPS heptosyltransferase